MRNGLLPFSSRAVYAQGLGGKLASFHVFKSAQQMILFQIKRVPGHHMKHSTPFTHAFQQELCVYKKKQKNNT